MRSWLITDYRGFSCKLLKGSEGCTVDFLPSRRRDMAAAKRFFSKAMKQHPGPI